MIVIAKTTIGFVIPDEYKQMMEFAEKNTDWVRHESTMMISFTKETTYTTNALTGYAERMVKKNERTD